MLVAAPQTIETDLLDDFYSDFTEQYSRCENTLVELERHPNNSELLNTLFRCVHTIKGNLVYIGLKDISPILHAMEHVLGKVRAGDITYDDSLSDIILLALDKTKLLVDENIHGIECNIDQQLFLRICDAIETISSAQPSQLLNSIQAASALLDPDSVIEPTQDTIPEDPFLQQISRLGVSICEDMTFICNLIPALEKRSCFWSGRSYRIAEMALQLNMEAGSPVNPEQLLMAALAHDIAMPFLPLSLLHKEEALTDAQLSEMQNHVFHSSLLLDSLSDWTDATKIVLQHHERCDGSGYPYGLQSSKITNGAKILAIADTFDACRYARAYRTLQTRPLVRAILEINRHQDTKFDPYWVGIFNRLAKKIFTHK